MIKFYLKNPFYFFKNIRPLSIIILMILPVSLVFSQHKKAGFEDSVFAKYQSHQLTNNNSYYVIQKNKEQEFCGFKIIRVISPLVNIIRINDPLLLHNKNICAYKIAAANDLWKLSPSLENSFFQLPTSNAEQSFIISADDINQLLYKWKEKKIPVKISTVYKESKAAIIHCKTSVFINDLLPDSLLLFADKYVKAKTEVMLIGYNRSLHTINLIQNDIPAANGHDIIIGIKENRMNETDIDLQKRINTSVLASLETDEHATVVATLAGGAGNSFYLGRGLAWKCIFYPSSYSSLFPDNNAILFQNNVSVQNHSYGSIIQNFYGAEAVAYDAQTWQNKNIVHIFSSGNKGQEAAPQGKYSNIPGFGNLTGNFKMAKNIITVAATDTGGNSTAFSSAGPLYDGRMAPQIAALGPNGTSDAAAIVSGAVAVIQQVYKDSNNQLLPASALIKSILYNSADDIGNKGIDYRSGFGSLNVYEAIKTIQEKRFDGASLAQNETWIKNITVPNNAANLKITLAWTDTAASLNIYKALTNDLDLQLVETSTANVYMPWCLSSFASKDSLNNLPFRKRDSLNTTEQVSIDVPVAGSYQIKINAKQIQTTNKQAFNIAFSWDTLNLFKFTSPVNASDVDRNEDPALTIKWDCIVADTNSTGSLYITYNNGSTWQQIAASIKLFKQKYSWSIPDTATTAMFRMDGSFGSSFSKSFFIAPVTKLKVEFLCTDSMLLSWNKHIATSAYQLFALTDSAYLKPVAVISDTAVVIIRNSNSPQLYAVQPLPVNGLLATRSAIIDVNNQGVKCFYKTLLAENRTNKIELILELSSFENIDSIVFEKLDNNSTVIKTLRNLNTTSGLVIYTAFDEAPVSGINFYRATIRLKNGAKIITETVSVLSNANQFVLLYPNPARRNLSINFQINNFTTGLNFQILDVQGRLIKTQLIGGAGQIITRGLNAGIFIFRIFNTDGALLETGKFVITK